MVEKISPPVGIKNLDGSGLPQSGKNIWKMKFFQGQGKVREVCGCQGNLERTWKVREKSGNLKINGYGRQTSENLFIYLLSPRTTKLWRGYRVCPVRMYVSTYVRTFVCSPARATSFIIQFRYNFTQVLDMTIPGTSSRFGVIGSRSRSQ